MKRDIRKEYIHLLYPKGAYEKKMLIVINRWKDIGFLDDLDELTIVKLSVLFEQALNILSSNLTTMKTAEYETAVFPIIRRVVPYVNENKIIDIKFVINYVTIEFPKLIAQYSSDLNFHYNIDFEAEMIRVLSEELIKELNK